ncbi:MAG: GAF domain-containing protein [Deltaproteobacteria bacterium]|nr:GAF domain-containing protein [Deltaproteobacteria bacterium]
MQPTPEKTGAKIDEPLYNSKIIQIFVDYISLYHPEVDINKILTQSWINTYEIEDPGHWFSQWQVDRFSELVLKSTGDRTIPRKAGRYAVSSQSVQRQYLMGLMNPVSVYLLMEKLYPILSRAAIIKTKKLGANKVEIISTPKPGVNEKPYQCENRIGIFESLAKLFTREYARIEHPSCLHKGQEYCRYIVTWAKTPSVLWRRISLYFLLLSIIISLSSIFIFTLNKWITFTIFFACITIILFFYSEHLEKRELITSIESQGNAAKDLLDEINTRYNNALLVKEIGQATSMLMDTDRLLGSIISVMEKRLDFDRGGIWMADKNRKNLVWKCGYGYDSDLENLLRSKHFSLDNPESKGVAVQAFKMRKPYLVNNLLEIEGNLSGASLDFVRSMGSQSFICVPIVFKRNSLGLLMVDNLKSKKTLTESHLSLLMGIAPQIAISIHNAMSYQALQISKSRERNLRKLFEKYVPSSVIQRYSSGDVDLFSGDESFITALFLDIRGFTSSSEEMDPADVVSLLNKYFEECSQIISEEHGHINKYTGDGFLAIFGAPEPLENHIEMGFRSVCRILEHTGKFILGDKRMEIGIGLHSGKAILGNLGSRTKMEYTAIGDTVNTTARLQELTKVFPDYPLIMSRDVWEKIDEGNPYRDSVDSLGMQEIRGKKEKVETFGLKYRYDEQIK